MHFKFHTLLLVIGLGFSLSLYGQVLVDCNILQYTEGSCNPYGTIFIYDKERNETESINQSLSLKDSSHTKQNINSDKLTNIQSIDRLHTENNSTLSNTEYIDIGIYHVKLGDFLGKIANKFNISITKILKLNDMDKSDTLKIGEVIKIPLNQKMVDAIDTASYKIEKGDTLLSISKIFNVDTKLLIKVNELHSTVIQEGKRLILPLPHKMKMLKKIELQRLAQQKAEEKRVEKQKRLAQKKKKQYIRRKSIGRNKLRVTATAYSSHRAQTDSTPFVAAWNNRLRPGMKIIAVSRDLLSRYGLRNGTRVRISGLRGYYRVRDKMNKRFKKRIDIYMGMDRKRALRWGRRSVNIYW